MHFHVTRYNQSNTHSFIDKINVAKPQHTTSPSADHKVLNFILHILNIGNRWIKDKVSSQISRNNMSQVTNYFYMLRYSVEDKSSDRKIHAKFIRSMHNGIIFYEYVAARTRYVGTNVSCGVVALRGVSVFARSTEGCPAFTTESYPAG